MQYFIEIFTIQNFMKSYITSCVAFDSVMEMGALLDLRLGMRACKRLDVYATIIVAAMTKINESRSLIKLLFVSVTTSTQLNSTHRVWTQV